MKQIFILVLSSLILLGSCDEGNIYPEEVKTTSSGFSAKFSGTISGYQDWEKAEKYSLVIACFPEVVDNNKTQYAILSKTIPTPDNSGKISVVLTNIPQTAKTVEICVIGSLRNKLLSFYSQNITEQDTMFMVADLNADMFKAVQDNIFTPTCSSCHGGSSSAAAGVVLTEGNVNIVTRNSKNVEGSLLVSPGDYQSSVLYKMLSTDLTSTWKFDHSRLVTSSDLLTLVKLWIDNQE